MVSRLHAQDAEILSTEHTPEGTRLHVRVREDLVDDLERYLSAPHTPAGDEAQGREQAQDSQGA